MGVTFDRWKKSSSAVLNRSATVGTRQNVSIVTLVFICGFTTDSLKLCQIIYITFSSKSVAATRGFL